MEHSPKVHRVEQFNAIGEWVNLRNETPIMRVTVGEEEYEIDLTPFKEPAQHSLTVQVGDKTMLLEKVDEGVNTILIIVSRFYRLMPVTKEDA